MLEQGPPAPAIEGPDRGDPWRLAIELPTEMGEDVRRDAFDGVERVAGHLEKTDLQRERHPVHGEFSHGLDRLWNISPDFLRMQQLVGKWIWRPAGASSA